MRRTPLRGRRRPMLPGKPLARRTSLRDRPPAGPVQPEKKPRRRSTDPTAAQRAVVAERANWCCERCGISLWHPDTGWHTPHSFHHRQPRGMGGTSRLGVHSPSVLMLLCGTGTTACHGWVEAHRREARDLGYLVRQLDNPAAVPVLAGAQWILLELDGSITLTSAPDGCGDTTCTDEHGEAEA